MKLLEQWNSVVNAGISISFHCIAISLTFYLNEDVCEVKINENIYTKCDYVSKL